MRETLDVLLGRRPSQPAASTTGPAKRALILSGGGARAAYQVGVLKALAEILPDEGAAPFPIICGTSAGAINALALACHPGSFQESVSTLEKLWLQLTPEQIYRTDIWSLIKGGLRLSASLLNEGSGRRRPVSLLDNSPLHQLINQRIRFDQLQQTIEQKKIEAACVTALGYNSGQSVSFFQGHSGCHGWSLNQRVGHPCQLTADHLMASSAIPTLFPTVRINREYFGDGALRQLAPISPALHLGAEQIFIIGVSGNRIPEHWVKRQASQHSPSMAQIMGHMLASAFIDSLENDIDNLERINSLVELVPEEQRLAAKLPLQKIDNLVISPTEQLDQIAGQHIRDLPLTIRVLLRSIGATARGGGATAASYLLFAPSFCSRLIDLGYKDTMWERAKIEQFFIDGANKTASTPPSAADLSTA